MDRPTWNEHLVAFHRKYNNPTGELMELLRTTQGVTSYELLAAKMRKIAPHARDILEVGCGDGVLLERLVRSYGPDIALRGIDLCEADIERARERVPEATFIQGDASNHHLGQKSQDVVASHLAFMAIAELRTVLTRVREALREGGSLVFVVEDPLANDAIIRLIGSAIAQLRTRVPTFMPSAPRREQIEHDAILRALLSETGFSRVSIEHFRVGARLSEEQLWRFIVLAYPLGLLDDEALRGVRGALHAELASLAHADAEVTLALRLVDARA